MKDVRRKLDTDGIKYEEHKHKPVFTSQAMAQIDHVHGINVAKPVIVNADGRYYMCVLGACYNIDFNALKSVLRAETVRLAGEDEMVRLFPDCEIGAEPPFGSLFGIPTILDDRMETDEFVQFQSGTHTKSISISMKDYMKIETPRIFSFSFHV